MSMNPPMSPTVDPDLARRSPDDDIPPRSTSTTTQEPSDFSHVPDQEDGPEDLEQSLAEDLRRRRAGGMDVKWADDRLNPDYAHLLPAVAAGVTPMRLFRLTPDVLDLVIRANSFNPIGPNGVIVFALRGGMLTSGSQTEDQEWIEIEDTRPNHSKFRCTIGFYDRTARRVTGYAASTVPVAANMARYRERLASGVKPSSGVNMLPSGCYLFRVNAHSKGRIKPALRMTEPGTSDDDAVMTVLRTHDDLMFTHADVWDKTQPYDNVHCAYSDQTFSSSGCLTIKGADGAGPWGRFQTRLKAYPWNTQISVVLITARDAAIAAQLIATNRHTDAALVLKCLGRLRVGSEGPIVAELQKKLGSNGTGYFGASTRYELVKAERALGRVNSDSIYCPEDDVAFGWRLMLPTGLASPVVASAGQLQNATGTDDALQAAASPSVSPSPHAANAIGTTTARAPAVNDVISDVRPADQTGAPAPTSILTLDALRRLAPRGKDGYLMALARNGGTLLAEYGIVATPLRLCHFIAQIGHESGGFTIEEENMTYTTARRICEVWPKRFPTLASAQPYVRDARKLANKVYGGRFENNAPDDGYRYRGRGLIQITGRESYRIMGRKLGIDLEGNPDLAFDPEIALRIAVETWSRARPGTSKLNDLADANKIEPITQVINGGQTNIEDRRRWLRAAWTIWGAGAAPVAANTSDSLERGDSGPKVAELQRLLVRAGLFPANEVIDGRFGAGTQRAVARFQARTNLNVSGIADKATWTALERAPATPYSRSAEQAGDVRRRGFVRRAPESGDVGTWRDIFRLTCALLLILGWASLVLGTSAAADNPTARSQVLLVSLTVASLGALLGIISLWGVWRRAAPSAGVVPSTFSNQSSVPALADGTVSPPQSDGLGPSFDPPTPIDTAPADFRALDQKLRALGFDERLFSDDEPIRSVSGVPVEEGSDAWATIPPAALELTSSNALNEPAAIPAAARANGPGRPLPFPVSATHAPFVVIAMFGGDNNLTDQVMIDINEMAAGAARYGGVSVLALADTETGPGTVIEVTPGGRVQVIERMAEIDTGDPETLAAFLARALVTYPRSRKAIGFWDHGTGVFDEQDETEKLLTRAMPKRSASRRPARRLCIPSAHRAEFEKDPATRAMLHDNSGGVLTNLEAGRMLKAAFERAGQSGKIDLIYSDTCLNGMIEVVEELGEFAHCFVASCDTEPSTGWDYEEWIRRMAQAVPPDPADWARHAVQAFAASYHNQTAQFPCTLSAFAADNEITECFARLVDVTQKRGLGGFSMLNLARGQAQAYDSRDCYDLIHFSQLLTVLAATQEPEIAQASADLAEACRAARIDTVAFGPTVQQAQGIAFWFPSSQRSLSNDIATYRRLSFSRATNWADYLSSMYGVSPVS